MSIHVEDGPEVLFESRLNVSAMEFAPGYKSRTHRQQRVDGVDYDDVAPYLSQEEQSWLNLMRRADQKLSGTEIFLEGGRWSPAYRVMHRIANIAAHLSEGRRVEAAMSWAEA